MRLTVGRHITQHHYRMAFRLELLFFKVKTQRQKSNACHLTFFTDLSFNIKCHHFRKLKFVSWWLVGFALLTKYRFSRSYNFWSFIVYHILQILNFPRITRRAHWENPSIVIWKYIVTTIRTGQTLVMFCRYYATYTLWKGVVWNCWPLLLECVKWMFLCKQVIMCLLRRMGLVEAISHYTQYSIKEWPPFWYVMSWLLLNLIECSVMLYQFLWFSGFRVSRNCEILW